MDTRFANKDIYLYEKYTELLWNKKKKLYMNIFMSTQKLGGKINVLIKTLFLYWF